MRAAHSRRVRGLSPRIETPHPALRATFSHKGRRKMTAAHSNFKQRADTGPHARGAMRPRFAFGFTLPGKEGRRGSRAPIAPAVVHKKRTSGPQVNRIIRLSLHDGLRLIRAHPGDRAFLPPSPCGYQMYR